MNKKFIKKIFFLSSIIAPIAISTPLILTSCSNSGSEQKPGDGSTGGNTNQTQADKITLLNVYDSKFNDNKINVESGITADGTLKLVTNVEVDENTTIDSIVDSLNAKNEKNGNTTFNTENSDNKLNFVKLMENSDARTKGFDISSKTIQNSAFVFQSFLSNDVKIEATKPKTKNNSSITVTVQTQNNKEWNIDKLKKIEFNITIKHVKDLSKQIMFFSSTAVSKLVKSDNTNNKIILKNTLNPDYQIKKDSNNPLNTISNNSIDEIKQWLTKGTIPNDPTKNGESSGEQSSTLNLDIFCQLIYSDIFKSDFTNVKAPSQEGNRDVDTTITLKKEDLFPGVLRSENITTKVNVTQKQTIQKLLSSKASLNNNIKVITIELTPNNNYWYGVNDELKNSTVVLELEIPAAKLEPIYLFKGNWDNFKLKDNKEFVFTNNLDENYAEFSWKDSGEVLKYFTATPDNSSKEETPATNKLNEESFVKLFYKDVFKNAEFTNDSNQSSDSGNKKSVQKLSTLDVLPYLIDDDEIDTKVEVKDKTNPATFNSEKPAPKKGESKTVEITLTPKPGYGWSALYNSSNQSVKVNADKPVKFVLDINPSDALIPINGLLDSKLIKTYTSKDKGNKPVYWFECNSHDDKSIKTKFNYSKATEKIQHLVKEAVYAGPNQEAKTKTAASQLWTVNDKTDKFTWDDKESESVKNKKVSYLNKDFDLKENFDIFKNLVIDQDFINVSNETTSANENQQDPQNNAYLAVAGKTLWYLNENDKGNLAEQIKCSLMISTSIDISTSNKDDKEIVYYVSFRLEPRNGGNWQNSNNNNPIDIDVTFDVKNAATIMDNTPTQSQKAGLTTPSPNMQGDKIEFEGTLKKEFFGEEEFKDAAAIEKHFEKQSSSGGARKLNKASNIDLEKIRKLPTHLEGNLINKEPKNNQNDQSDGTPESKTFEFPGTNLSFKYLSDSDAPLTGEGGYSQRNLKAGDETGDENYINDKLMFIKDLTVTENINKTNKSLSDDEAKPTPKSYTIQFELELDKTKKTSWYWGSWNDLLPTNPGDANRSNQNLLIKLNVTI